MVYLCRSTTNILIASCVQRCLCLVCVRVHYIPDDWLSGCPMWANSNLFPVVILVWKFCWGHMIFTQENMIIPVLFSLSIVLLSATTVRTVKLRCDGTETSVVPNKQSWKTLATCYTQLSCFTSLSERLLNL